MKLFAVLVVSQSTFSVYGENRANKTAGKFKSLKSIASTLYVIAD